MSREWYYAHVASQFKMDTCFIIFLKRIEEKFQRIYKFLDNNTKFNEYSI